jgi:hypothetical protein
MPPKYDASRAERFRYEYGAGPLHLLAVLASLALALYAILRIFEIPSTGGILLWMGLAIVAHDFIALPLYSLFLRVAEEGVDATVRPRRRALLTLNHIRIPAAFSLLLLLISFPLVFQIDEPRYELTTGLDLDRFLGNWLLITAVMFGVSGLLLALKVRTRAANRPMSAPPSGEESLGTNSSSEVASRIEDPIDAPLALRIGAKFTLGGLALLTLFVAALAIYGVFESFPI